MQCQHIIVTTHSDRRRSTRTSRSRFAECHRPATTGSEECKQHAAWCGKHRSQATIDAMMKEDGRG